MNTKGVIYYKLDETYKYPGDEVKKCGLTGGEIDSNMLFLRGYDIETAEMDYLTNTLILKRVNGEEIPVKIDREDFVMEQLNSLIESVSENKDNISILLKKDEEIEANISSEIENRKESINTLSDSIGDISITLIGHTSDDDLHVTTQQKKEWQDASNAINAFLDENAVADNVINTLVEIREYLNGEDGSVEALISNVAENKNLINKEIIDRKTADEELREELNEEIGRGKEECKKYTTEECGKIDEKLSILENAVDKNKNEITSSLTLIENEIKHLTNEVEENEKSIENNGTQISALDEEIDRVELELAGLKPIVDAKANKDWVLEKIQEANSENDVANLEDRVDVLGHALAKIADVIITTENVSDYIKGDNATISVEQNTDDNTITIRILNIHNTTF